MPTVNGKEVSFEEAKKAVDDPKKIVDKLTISFPNTKREDCPVTMEGFDLPKDYFVTMAKTSTRGNCSVTASFKKCAKLGNKTVIITVQDHDHDEVRAKSAGRIEKLYKWVGRVLKID